MSSVSLTSVSVRFDTGAFGLRDIDLDVDDGEFLSLVGPSGSGKTTLLRSIAGFTAPTAGEILIGGETVAGPQGCLPPERRRLGMVFQEHAVWPHWDVRRNVEYPLRRAGVGRVERRRRVEEALELVGLEGFDTRKPATLSGGQRQRIALARALVARPRVLLLDEALSALDEPLRDRLRLELRSLTRELGLTVIHVTHDRQEALALADRVAVLNGGRIEEIGTPEQMLRAPGTPFVAQFLSDATLVRGHVESGIFRAEGHPLTIPCHTAGPLGGVGALVTAGALGGSGITDGTVRAAIVPSAIRLSPAVSAQRAAAERAAAGGASASPEHSPGHSRGEGSRAEGSRSGASPADVANPGTSPAEASCANTALVRSSLFTAAGSDLVIDWQGLEMRVRTAQSWFDTGEQVLVDVDDAIFYPETPPSAAPAERIAVTA